MQSLPRRATFLGKSLRCKPARANTGPSCNLGVPRRLFEELGGFDEELPYYFEDSDLCIRARRAGAVFTFAEDAVFRHKGSEKKQGDAIRLQEAHSTYAMLKLYRGEPTKRMLFMVLNTAWMLARALVWRLRGRSEDAKRLWRGHREGMARFKN